MSTKKAKPSPKPPARVMVYSFLEYVSPIFGLLVQLLIGGYYDLQTTMAIFKAPVFLVYFAVVLILPFILHRVFINKIRSYDGSEETLIKASKASYLYTKISIYVPVIFCIFFPIWLCLNNILPDDPTRKTAVV